MSQKEELLKKAEEFNRRATQRRPPDKPYDGSGMISRMPLGCWLWILGLVALVVYFIGRFFVGVH